MHYSYILDRFTGSKQGVLYEWIRLNFIGWILALIWLPIGMFFVYPVYYLFDSEIIYKYHVESILIGILCWFPFGALLGTMQFLQLRRLNLQVKYWILFTALGWLILGTGFLLAEDYIIRLSSPPFWLIHLCPASAIVIGGAVLGWLQAKALKNHHSKPSDWILKTSLGIFALYFSILAISLLVYSLKSIMLNFLYSLYLYFIVDARWFLFGGFLMLVTPFLSAITISRPTGLILQKAVVPESRTEIKGSK